MQNPFLNFLIVLLTFVGLGHIAVSYALISAFSLSRPWSLVAYILPLLLMVGFVGATMLGWKYYNFFTSLFYRITATWIGLFVYFLLAAFIYALIVFIGKFIFPDVSFNIVGVLLFVLATGITIYGLFNAQHIVVKKVDVKLANLPESWKGKTAVFVSDLHLGQIRGGEFSKEVVQKINELHPDIVLIGGDLFDGTAYPKGSLAPFKELKSEWGTYFITGNHDEFRTGSEFVDDIKNQGIKVLDNELVNINGMQLIGVDYLKTEDRAQFAQVLKSLPIDSNEPSILLKHVPSNMDITADRGISLQLSGHTHRAQMWPLSYIPAKVYKGFDYDLKTLGTTQVFTSSGVGTWGPPVRVGTNSEIVLITFK